MTFPVGCPSCGAKSSLIVVERASADTNLISCYLCGQPICDERRTGSPRIVADAPTGTSTADEPARPIRRQRDDDEIEASVASHPSGAAYA